MMQAVEQAIFKEPPHALVIGPRDPLSGCVRTLLQWAEQAAAGACSISGAYRSHKVVLAGIRD